MGAESKLMLSAGLRELIDAGRAAEWVESASTATGQRVHHQVTLDLGKFGGAGLLIRTFVAHQPLVLWVPESEWCELAAVMLPNNGFSTIPVEMHAAIAAWMLNPLTSVAQARDLPTPGACSVERASCAATSGCLLRVLSHDIEVSFGVVEGPVEWISNLASAMTVVEAVDSNEPRKGVLAAGWATLHVGQLEALEAGSALVLDVDAPVESGYTWLMLNGRATPMLFDGEGGAWTVQGESIGLAGIAEAQDDGDEPTNDDAVVVVAEIGMAKLTTGMERRMKPSATVELDVELTGAVKLVSRGRIAGIGDLLRVGERLVVKLR